MSDVIQLLALILLPVSVFLIFLAFSGVIAGFGFGGLAASVVLWMIGRELNIAKQKAIADAEERALTTGWTDEERRNLGSTNG